MTSVPVFQLRLFGAPSIEVVEGRQPLTGRATQRHRIALLALIAMAPGQRLSRDKLLGYLWPESDAERGRNLLKVATYVLRSTLGELAVLSEGDDLRLDPVVVGVDTAEFDAALERRDFAAAVALYRGPFLDGFFVSDAPDFEQWASRERERLARGYGSALEALATACEERGDFSRAAEWWKLRAAQDPYDSRVAVRLMQVLEAGGNRAAALQHASVHERMLKQEFGIAVPAEIASLAERLRRQTDAAERTADLAPELVAEVPLAGLELKLGPRRPFTWVAALVLLAAVGGGAIWSARPTAADDRRSIAVLPFVNISGDSANEYFSDGLTEEIITGLAGVPGLKVISRTSAMHYKGSRQPLREIASALGVEHILEGSVRRSGNNVRISAQLIDARDDAHLWAQNYDTELRDIVGVQEQIARQVASALELSLGERSATSLVRKGTSDAEAYDFYRRGRYLWDTRTREGHERALEYFNKAIARDSNYADAYAGIGNVYMTSLQLNLTSLSEPEVYARMKWAAERALALDERSADAHVTYATSLLWLPNWPGAERELRRALELNPSHATGRSWYGLVLAGMGRLDEAVEQSRRAFELDPFAVVVSSNYGWQCYLKRDFECDIAQQRRTLEISPSWGRAYARLATAYAASGRLDDALAAIRKAIELTPERPDFVADLAYVLALRGETAEANRMLLQAKRRPFEPFHIARAFVALRQDDSAFVWLERSNWRWPHRAVRWDPALDRVRSDPRFARLSLRIDSVTGMR
ncbi:MAG: BTAD domain-containing putative transcriptional regulator [Gemmatimonadaceae bacterium]